jgi:hypothetical protein
MYRLLSLVWISARSAGALLDQPAGSSSIIGTFIEANSTDTAVASLADDNGLAPLDDGGSGAGVPAFLLGIVTGLAPLIYTLMGGMRSLRAAHVIQGLIMAAMILLCTAGLPRQDAGFGCWTCRVSKWPPKGALSYGIDALVARILQGAFSLPW